MKLSIKDKMLQFIYIFLTNRIIQISINNKNSKIRTIANGILQGLVNSLVLMNVVNCKRKNSCLDQDLNPGLQL
jgi:hypothetical protein